MAAVVAVVVRDRRAFPGGTAARVVDDVGGRRDEVPRPFGCRAVMIARARSSGRFGAVWPVFQRQTRSPAVNAHGTRGFGSAAPQIYKSREREG
jgi:hypothetical protein